MHAKIYTEPIVMLLDHYRSELTRHPLLEAARGGTVSTTILKQFALYQYADSILWIPMLAQMKARAVRSGRLRRAIEDNIACEAGLGGTSHVQLAVDLMKSLGAAGVDDTLAGAFARNANEWLSASWAEPEIAGWLLVAETLVPIMFADFVPCFARLGCATAYFTEHVAVDRDEHAAWMTEAVTDVVELYGGIARVIAGMEQGWDETIDIPDLLHAQLVRETTGIAAAMPA